MYLSLHVQLEMDSMYRYFGAILHDNLHEDRSDPASATVLPSGDTDEMVSETAGACSADTSASDFPQQKHRCRSMPMLIL